MVTFVPIHTAEQGKCLTYSVKSFFKLFILQESISLPVTVQSVMKDARSPDLPPLCV